MAFENDYPNVDYLTGEFVDAVAEIKKALVDGRFEPSEVAQVVRAIDPALSDYLGKLLTALKGLYGEVDKLTEMGPFGMMMTVAPYFAGRLMRIFQ